MGQFSEYGHIQYPEQKAAVLLGEAQHAMCVKCRYNHNTFRVEYVKPNGELVPDYKYFLQKALGRL
jgi:hypothetical protein